ncbi:LacI family DNA-binding transcriptional regulator [Streptomyces sp. 3MP-14]|uniref:LacI family DNA-binding transcriptional regulator n=1 Tax=Streptomyces mimosae TaxID=2586635 RepID=A0A5N5ZNJ8_9ACTN|nr:MULTISPECIES: LacI family DNA-binding transcriptional regulator [Streptomyces]KAB8157885.1 LacI family DNA-binding transcriptional regulator [Streptomyces mimosae]KAB8172386.1 LacI family DNA-binding transcriptional regulator [Streptomyces sp. 3MP-14]
MPDAANSPGARPTLRDVAQRAGVSAMTVTRVLREDSRVSAATRERVLASVAELGYRPNTVARSLRLGRGSGLVGLVVTNLANPFYSRLALGVDSVVGPHGLKTVIGNTRQSVEHERDLVADLVGRRVDGIVVVPAGGDQRHLAQAAAQGVPVVCASRPPVGFPADHVLVDDHGGARDATERLLALGHRRIGFLGPPASVHTSVERLRGYRETLAAAGVAADERYVRQGPVDVAAAEAAAGELLALAEPPTALFCSNNRNTIGAFRAVSRAGLTTALAGFDDFELADMLGLPLSVQSYDSDELGSEAGRLLLDRLRGGARDAPPRRVVLPTRAIQYGTPRPLA